MFKKKPKRYTLGSSSIGWREKRYVKKVLRDNFISPGPVVAEVEAMCAEMHGLKHCVTLNSGQAAIQVGLQALIRKKFGVWHGWDLPQKPTVAVPACTYISTLAAAYYAGCTLALVDVDLKTGNMSPDSLSSLVRQGGIDFVIPVHLYGKACDSRIEEICENYNLRVLEDAAEATLAPGIGWGDILITSFFSNHLISGGSGGAIMTNDPELDFWCWQLINHGREQCFDNNDIFKIADKFRFSIWGHSMKWSDLNAAIVKAQLERVDKLYAMRQRNAMILQKALTPLQNDGWLLLPDPKDHCFMMYPIILDESLQAEVIIADLNRYGIETRRMMPITNQKVVMDSFPPATNFSTYLPNADYINRQGFYVGCHPELTKKDMNRMADTILDVVVFHTRTGEDDDE